jgi:hypothetical protein
MEGMRLERKAVLKVVAWRRVERTAIAVVRYLRRRQLASNESTTGLREGS